MLSPRICLLLILCLIGQLALAPLRDGAGMHAAGADSVGPAQELDSAVAAHEHCGGAPEQTPADHLEQAPAELCCAGPDCDCDCSRVMPTALRLDPALLAWSPPARAVQHALAGQLPRHIHRPPLRPPAYPGLTS